MLITLEKCFCNLKQQGTTYYLSVMLVYVLHMQQTALWTSMNSVGMPTMSCPSELLPTLRYTQQSRLTGDAEREDQV